MGLAIFLFIICCIIYIQEKTGAFGILVAYLWSAIVFSVQMVYFLGLMFVASIKSVPSIAKVMFAYRYQFLLGMIGPYLLISHWCNTFLWIKPKTVFDILSVAYNKSFWTLFFVYILSVAGLIGHKIDKKK